MEGSQVLADRGYDSQKLIDYIYDQGGESNRHPLNVWKMKNPAGKYWKRYVLLRCIWHCPVLQWEYCRAFPSVLLESSTPGRYVTRGRLPEGGCQKPLSCTICGNIFFRLLGKQPELYITQIIQEQQDESGAYWGSWAS